MCYNHLVGIAELHFYSSFQGYPTCHYWSHMARCPDGHKWPKWPFMAIWPLGHVRPITVKKITHMGRKGSRAKTKTVLKSVSKLQQFDSMPNLRFQTLLNKDHPWSVGSTHWVQRKSTNYFGDTWPSQCCTHPKIIAKYSISCIINCISDAIARNLQQQPNCDCLTDCLGRE